MFSVGWGGEAGGGKVTTQIVILQKQPEFLKIPSIPVYKAATDCSVTMETCSRFSSWFWDSCFRPENVRCSPSQRWQTQPQERAAGCAPCWNSWIQVSSQKEFHCVNNHAFWANFGTNHRFWRLKKSLILLFNFPNYLESCLWPGNPYFIFPCKRPTPCQSF